MCGRYTLATPADFLAELFGVEWPKPFPDRYNIAPTQDVVIVRRRGGDGEREAGYVRWGLVPFWADSPSSLKARMINARSETAAKKPAFRAAFSKRRCLLPADGFYEWNKTGSGKQPYHFRRAEGRPFAFAGLWEYWRPEDAGDDEPDELYSCTLLTTEPNQLVAEVHDRMPVILPEERYDDWLDPGRERDALQELLVPYDASDMECFPVSKRVNSPSNDDAQCVEPLDGAEAS